MRAPVAPASTVLDESVAVAGACSEKSRPAEASQKAARARQGPPSAGGDLSIPAYLEPTTVFHHSVVVFVFEQTSQPAPTSLGL